MISNHWKHNASKVISEESIGFFLDVEKAGLGDHFDPLISEKFSHAFDQMSSLEKGALSNPDEKRQVGHYWLRAPHIAPSLEISNSIETTQKEVQHFANNILSGEIASPGGDLFSNLLLIGIGGSALGPQFVVDALHQAHGLIVDYIDNTDPNGMDATILKLEPVLPTTLILVISKSGGTAETRNGMLEVQHTFKMKGLEFSKQAVAITGTGSNLYNLAISENWLSIFPMWDWVGGRTSVMSAVGLLPSALAGINIQDFLQGAAKMDILTREADLQTNPAAQLALSWLVLGNSKGEKDMVILPYKDRLLLFSRYLQQLIMESLGKRFDLDGKTVHQGIAVYGNKGSTDQHAYVQQLRDGLNNFFVTFIEVLKDRDGDSILVDDKNTSGDYLYGFLKGTESALAESDRKSITITIEDLSPKSVGALIALYERAVGLYALIVNINAYHQPGVEAGKKAAGNILELKNNILDLLKSEGSFMSVQDICQALRLDGQERLVYQTLRHHLYNHELQVEGSVFEPESLKVSI